MPDSVLMPAPVKHGDRLGVRDERGHPLEARRVHDLHGTSALAADAVVVAVEAVRVRASNPVQAELLGTYAVDLLPIERMAGSLSTRGAIGTLDEGTILVTIAGALIRVVGFAINAVMALLVFAWIAGIVLEISRWVARLISGGS
jgi:hypothetical protein